MPDNAFHSESIYEENIDGQSLITKKYKSNEGLKEINIYNNLLEKDRNLLAPKCHSFSIEEKFLKLIRYDPVDKITPEILDAIQEWLVYKYNKYKNSQGILDLGINIKRYNRPRLEYLSDVFKQSVIEDILKNQNIIAESIIELSKLPFTLEQGDLQKDNLLKSKDGGLVICDWVLANVSNGLVDVLKYIEMTEKVDPSSLERRVKLLEGEMNIQNIQKFTIQEGIIHYLSRLEYFSIFYRTGSNMKIHGLPVDTYIDDCLQKFENLWRKHTHNSTEERI